MTSNHEHLSLSALAARIRGGVNTLILFHRHPDGDAVGSGFALKLLLEAMGCTVYCVCEDEVPERLRFLAEGLQDSIKQEIVSVSTLLTEKMLEREINSDDHKQIIDSFIENIGDENDTNS